MLAWLEEVSDEGMWTPKEISALKSDTESSICCLVNYAKYACFGGQARHLICSYCFPEHNKYILDFKLLDIYTYISSLEIIQTIFFNAPGLYCPGDVDG